MISVTELDPQLPATVVCAEPRALACAPGHPLARQARITWGAVSDFEHVTLRSAYSTRRRLDPILKAQGLEIRSTIQAGTLATALGLVKANAGVTLIPGDAQRFAPDLGLKVLEIALDEPYLHELSLSTRKGLKPSVAAQSFMEHLHHTLAGIQPRRKIDR